MAISLYLQELSSENLQKLKIHFAELVFIQSKIVPDFMKENRFDFFLNVFFIPASPFDGSFIEDYFIGHNERVSGIFSMWKWNSVV